MGYRNTVMLCMQRSDYDTLVSKMDENAELKMNGQPLYPRTLLSSKVGAIPPDDLVEFEGNVAVVLDDISWNNLASDELMRTLDDMDCPYDFIRIGESIGDMEHFGAYEDDLALVCDWRTIVRPYAVNPKLPSSELIRPWTDNAIYGQ